ncbi:MAG: hypothetical protein KME32_06810 [Mojavia pulchra JT2-VF2]|jgi:hypothetical protein|uniref:Uncharacterized protein n=1 Tax=Mojavia pulchra JT2-VF2 TaxID=287848 RepID=A0A951PW05_9NOST|nr:hypothetical protein [Mojavia pulchra JT2-VF2]
MTSRKRSNSNKTPILNQHRQQSQKTNKSAANQTVSPPNISYSVAHAIPGRIRFRIPRIAKDSEYANKLKRVIESDSRTTNVRVNSTAASIVIHYQLGGISDDQMRSHLVNLIQTAPNVTLPAQVTAKSIATAVFDALINLIDSTRNINQARNAITHHQFRKDRWERLLTSAKAFVKGLKSTANFILPGKRSQTQTSPKQVSLQPAPL